MSRLKKNSVVPGPARGSVVTYRHRMEGVGDGDQYHVAVVNGPLALEPNTGELWVGVRTPRGPAAHTVDFITVASIVHVEPLGDH